MYKFYYIKNKLKLKNLIYEAVKFNILKLAGESFER